MLMLLICSLLIYINLFCNTFLYKISFKMFLQRIYRIIIIGVELMLIYFNIFIFIICVKKRLFQHTLSVCFN